MGGVQEEKKCLRCGSLGLGTKEIFCNTCVTEIFPSKENGLIFFCRKCRKYGPMAERETAIFLEKSGLKNVFDPQKQKAVLIIDSCPDCYEEGDQTSGQLATLTPIATA